tara:strand:+ start:1907 stop:2032 length:126 start_codon:yes stop_codon:yes gene_type:complete
MLTYVNTEYHLCGKIEFGIRAISMVNFLNMISSSEMEELKN